MHINYLKKFNNQKGMGLVEVIAAFSISIVVITSLVSLALYTMRASLNSKLLLEGTKIASREIERVRALRDTSTTWDDFVDAIDGTTGPDCTSSNMCYMTDNPLASNAGLSPAEVIDNNNVYRFFTVTKDAEPANIVRVAVEVYWVIGGVTKSTHVYTDLSNWQPYE